MRVLVTGATGFVGVHLCRALEAAGHAVTAAARRDVADEVSAAARWVNVGDLGPETDWRPALVGVDAVMHIAARTHVLKETATDADAAYRRVNVDATERLVAQAATAGVKRFVYLSSVKASGENSVPGTPLTDSDPPRPEDAYGRTKLAAEQLILRAAEAAGMNAAVLRPPLIYGPGIKGNLLTLFNAIDKGVPLPLGSVANKRSLVYVGNLVDVMIKMLATDAVAGRTYFITDGEDVSTPELVRRIAEALGRPARLLPMPTALLFLAGRLCGRTPTMQRIAGSLQIDDSPLRQTMDWSPPVTMKEGLEQTAAWFKSRGIE